MSKKNSNLLATTSDFIGFTTENEKIKPTKARFLSTIDDICEIIDQDITTIGSLLSLTGKIASFKATFPAASILHRFVRERVKLLDRSGEITIKNFNSHPVEVDEFLVNDLCLIVDFLRDSLEGKRTRSSTKRPFSIV